MARTGLYQSEVKKARDALIAQGKHPSVDAVRVALGNTGSKTTIHKYLKELEEVDGGAGRKTSVSEALQDLVARLAARLHEEGDARVEAIEARSAEAARLHGEALAALQRDFDATVGERDRLAAAAHQEAAAHELTRRALQAETIARHTAEEQVAGLKARLDENDAHLISLEEKHKHAREALEHYRQSTKEQRDQDQRRHEQQIQQLQAEIRQLQQALVVKQDDVTRLNQEGARLVADLSHARQGLYDQQLQVRELASQLAASQELAQQAGVLASQVASKDEHLAALRVQLESATGNAETLSARVRELELALATSQATLASQQEIAAALRAHLTSRKNKGQMGPVDSAS
ncbi:DNA-binding protein [Massilia sp. CF038]|uniref:DNA-binding protein n=1 Tax=Massilia sp. CF038 TaxID=1881045 RepID=UPI0009163FCB|nr:DNA-binding protein [Massilia sp. CF038]SHG76491.1 replication region DNA-binding N-term [Massilia sp. CF038]